MEEKKEIYIIPMNVQKTAFLGFFLFEGMEIEEIVILTISVIIGMLLFTILKPYSFIKAIFVCIVVIGLSVMLVKPESINNNSLYRELKQHIKYKKSQKLYKYAQL